MGAVKRDYQETEEQKLLHLDSYDIDLIIIELRNLEEKLLHQ